MARFLKRARPYAAAIYQGAQWGYNTGMKIKKAYREISKLRTDSRNTRNRDYGNITFQNDEHMIYKRKRAPRKLRKRLRKMNQRFSFMLDKQLARKKCLIPHTQSMTITPTTGSNAQVALGFTLYGAGDNNGAVSTNTNWANGDLAFIYKSVMGQTPPFVAAEMAYNLRFTSAVMNLNVKNVATSDAAFRDGLCIMDVYHVICRKSYVDTVGDGDPTTVWQDTVLQNLTLQNQLSVPTVQTDGCTPYSSSFGEYYTVKRVRRVRLSPGQTFSTQLRDPGNYVVQGRDIGAYRHLKNMTEGYILVAYNPSANPATSVRGSVALEVNYTKAYNFCVIQENMDQLGRSNLI